MGREVRAGGGVIWRQGGRGVEVLLIHRPRYDDWSLPKGKAKEGESDEDAALREVEEEIGLRCELGPELATTRYLDGKGRSKTVRYWAMELPAGAEPTTGDGVDELRWVPLDEADGQLSWSRDEEVLRALAERVSS